MELQYLPQWQAIDGAARCTTCSGEERFISASGLCSVALSAALLSGESKIECAEIAIFAIKIAHVHHRP